MSINCLNCHILRRIDSNCDSNKRCIDNVDTNKSSFLANKTIGKKNMAERSWSGNLMPPLYNNKYTDRSSLLKKVNFANQCRHDSAGVVPFCETIDDLMTEPRLVRSGGLRRDWSFEDLAASQMEAKRKI
ncbi:hypothetical protein RND81_13G014400 [Saponaria officinalis]|uniref:Uncharacterized protein n=1 Tax=Saponaria officinalis TaxID=3572 RepID=A0AAW1GVQ1_SAPOF